MDDMVIGMLVDGMSSCDPNFCHVAQELDSVAILFPCKVDQERESFNEKKL